jgi:hypothetical protein
MAASYERRDPFASLPSISTGTSSNVTALRAPSNSRWREILARSRLAGGLRVPSTEDSLLLGARTSSAAAWTG